MRKTLTIRLPDDLATWLSAVSRQNRVPQGQIIREHLQKARTADKRSFLRLAGAVAGPKDLSTRKGFSRR
ncbi:MAG: hypothetical protein JO211_11180 [Acidobacteriaceae bacterium]|nr:hypothetical protein [Acidobacteriaceae bacterium]